MLGTVSLITQTTTKFNQRQAEDLIFMIFYSRHDLIYSSICYEYVISIEAFVCDWLYINRYPVIG